MDDQKEAFLRDGFGKILWLDLVNSEHYDGFGNLTDHLHDDAWVSTFLEQYRFAGISQKQPPQQFIDLRKWLRHIAQTLDRNECLTGSDLDILNGYLAEPGVRELCYLPEDEEYRLTFKPIQPGWRWVQAEVLFSLVDMLDSKQRKRVKICPNPGCNWVFFDKTRGNNRRWCNDLTCGNRDKVRRYRSRQKTV